MTRRMLCISNDLNKLIQSKLELSDDKQAVTIKRILDMIPECKDVKPEPCDCEGVTKTKRVKGTRKKSKYNEFVSVCMKDIGKGVPVTERMKTCAGKWNAQKK